jgi:hypothetical protein
MWISSLFVAAIFCSGMGLARLANSSKMPDCHSRSAADDSHGADAGSVCFLRAGYGLLPKQTDFLPYLSLSAFLPQTANFTGSRNSIAHQTTGFSKPKGKLHLVNSVLTM